MINIIKKIYNQLQYKSTTKKDIYEKLKHPMPLHARLLLNSSMA